MNCDTRLAVNLGMLELSDYDEFIFVIKNYTYTESSYVFLYRAKKEDMDKNGEIIFNIDPDVSKNIKPGAFYNLALLVNAFNPNEPSEYKKLTENGKVILEYGAHDLALPTLQPPSSPFIDVLSARIEQTDEDIIDKTNGTIIDLQLEEYL
jgi:hypothetical protein